MKGHANPDEGTSKETDGLSAGLCETLIKEDRMKKVLIEEQDNDTIKLGSIEEHSPIFAKKDGELCGMIIREEGKGWILRLGGSGGCSGHHKSRRKCMKDGETYGYEFFT